MGGETTSVGEQAARAPGKGAQPDARVREMDLPRKNGELVFEAPWEGRAFGLAVALSDRKLFDWEDFRGRLASSIADSQDGPYYESWLGALEKLLVDRGVVSTAELDDEVDHIREHDEHGHDHEGHSH